MGIQECEAAYAHGVYPYIKHLAFNEQETNRNALLCTWFTEQSARELYLKPFEACVKANEGQALAIMSSYVYVGTTWDGGCSALLNDIVRGEWGYNGMILSDGPPGVRKQAGSGDQLGLNPSLPATCFPTAATIANSWDPALGEEIGEYLGEEAASQGVGVLLGPGLNIKRSPLCGRNFEYFSEDPYLAGKMAAGYIRGIQKNGVAACPKHFACNSQELRRVVSDWGGSNEHIEGVRAGSHLEMPTTGGDSDLELVQAVRDGKISQEIIDRRVDEILDVILPVTAAVAPLEGKPFDVDTHHKMAEKAAGESIVLLTTCPSGELPK